MSRGKGQGAGQCCPTYWSESPGYDSRRSTGGRCSPSKELRACGPNQGSGQDNQNALLQILNAIVLKASNRPAESLNSRVKMTRVRTRGFRNGAVFQCNLLPSWWAESLF